MPTSSTPLPLDYVFQQEKNLADRVYMTQPYAGGQVVNYTWKQAIHESRCMANYLKAKNLPRGSKIAIVSKNCAHWIMSDLAIWMAGHVSVPLYPTLTAESVRQILIHSEACLAFVGKLDNPPEILAGIPKGMETLSYPSSAPDCGTPWDTIVANTPPLLGEPRCEPDELATIIYTSGTTGMPKGVMHTHRTLGWSPSAFDKELGANSEDRMVSYLPLSHVAERTLLEMLSLRVGIHVFFTESLDTFVQDIRRARPTIFGSVPRLWVKFQQGVSAKMPEQKLKRMLKIPFLSGVVKKKILTQLGFDQVRMAVSGAAPTPESTLRWYRALGLNLLEGYGMTEYFGLSHLTQPEAIRLGYVGQTTRDVLCRIAEDGEILVKSPGNTVGYYKEPEKTQDLFTADGYIRTGDRGELDDAGRLKITGRVKEIFKTAKGKYVAPGPIENRLTAHSAVEACCVACPAEEGQPFAMLVLTLDAKAKLNSADEQSALAVSLSQHLDQLNAQLNDHEKLAFVVVCKDDWTVDNGMVTPTFKVKRHAVEQRYGQHMARWYSLKQAVLFE